MPFIKNSGFGAIAPTLSPRLLPDPPPQTNRSASKTAEMSAKPSGGGRSPLKSANHNKKFPSATLPLKHRTLGSAEMALALRESRPLIGTSVLTKV
ncbi:hypothetical protein [Thermoleptolyngbya sp.]